ncbi:hypothetical protein Vi05172_g5044 [Venturia inaequalis]|nr:hypothetical protein Vi05172_g5044 [Venturia inaequalis]
MKTGTLFFLGPLAVFAAPTVLETRQSPGLLSAGATALLKEMAPFKTESAPPTVKRPGAKRIKIFYGPIELLGANVTRAWSPFRMDPKGNSWTNIAGGLPSDITVLSANTTLQYEDGSNAGLETGVYNHHVMFGDVTRRSIVPLVCVNPAWSTAGKSTNDGPGGGHGGMNMGGGGHGGGPASMPMSVFMGTSADTGTTGATQFSTPDGMFNSGYYLTPETKIIMAGEVVNYTNETKKIFAVSDMEYIPGKPEGLLETAVMIASVTQCDINQNLKAPEGKTQFGFTSKEMEITGDGWILTRRGHVHDGGTTVSIIVNNATICDSTAIYGTNGQTLKNADGSQWQTVSAMSECNEPTKVKKGDKVVIDARYDLDLHPARKHIGGGMAEEMGMMSFLFASDPGGKGGGVPPLV